MLTPTIDPNPAINHKETRLVGKNGNGEGNIRQRPDGRWEARYCVETSEGPKRRSVYGKTRKEAAEKLAAKIANKDTEPVQKVEQTTITARDFFAEYLAAMKDTIKRRSYETSNAIIRLHLNPEFGIMSLTDVDRKGIQSMYARKRESLSAARVKRTRSESPCAACGGAFSDGRDFLMWGLTVVHKNCAWPAGETVHAPGRFRKTHIHPPRKFLSRSGGGGPKRAFPAP